MNKISTVGVLRLLATGAVACDKSVRLSAQDDDFVGVLTKNIQTKLVRSRQSYPGLRPGLHSVVPAGLNLQIPVLTRTL
jgi:hypothetical protein